MQRLQDEAELLGFAISGHPLDLHPDVSWPSFCPIAELHLFPGKIVTVAGLIIVSRSHFQQDGSPMKFISLCDYTGIVKCEIFAQTYQAQGLATVRYPVVQILAPCTAF